MTRSFLSRLATRARWRGWLATYILLALVWPAIGPMPWLIEFASAADRAQFAVASDEHDSAHHHHDASDIPGSPTHPDDHNCFQCDLIKHLARCVPADGVYPIVASVASHPPQPAIEIESIHAASDVPRPPIRGPPGLNG